jgi:NO-binding membrane sensor protein with MHYT domain
MHFIAMLAMKMPFEMQFNFWLTMASLIIAVVFVCMGLLIAGRRVGNLFLGGAIAGFGVACMHYLGMYAMQIPATVTYDSTIVALSVVIGVVASIVALWLAFNLKGVTARLGSAFIMGVAVCGMHYTGMYAATFTMDESKLSEVSGAISAQMLGIGVAMVTIVLLFTMLYFAMYQQIRPSTIKPIKLEQEF